MSIIKRIGAAHITGSQERVLQMMAACLAVLLAPNVKATCQANANLVPQNIQLNVGRVLIQPSLPIGSRITLLTFNINRVSNSGSCSSNGEYCMAVSPVQ